MSLTFTVLQSVYRKDNPAFLAESLQSIAGNTLLPEKIVLVKDGTHNTVLNLPDLSMQEMVDFCNYARKKYYLRPRYILHRLRVGLANPADLRRSIKAFGKLKTYLFKK